MHNSVIFSKFTELCIYHDAKFWTIPIISKRVSSCWSAVTPCSYPQPSATTNLLSVSIGLPFWGIAYKRNHTIDDFGPCKDIYDIFLG